MVFDATVPNVYETLFPQEDQQYTPYSVEKEAIPSYAPE